MKLYAKITINRNWPPTKRDGVLHLTDIKTHGGDEPDVTSAMDFAAFVAAHPEIGHVIVYDSRFTRRGRPWGKFIEKDAIRLWDEAELLAAFREVQRRRVADPTYIPTVAEALRNPVEFVDGMEEG